MKICFKCKVEKDRTDFYKHPAMKDGLLGKCKECSKKDSIQHRNDNLESYRSYDRERSKLPHRLELGVKINKEYRAKYPDRYKANTEVSNAVRDGRLEKWPCMVCGDVKSVGHHPDYSRPLDVVWLCQIHHKEAHALIKDVE